MTIDVAVLGSRGDTNTRSAYTCEVTGSPAANNMVLIGVIVNDAAGTPTVPSSVSGMGMVFSLESNVSFAGAGAGAETHNLSLWRSMGLAPDTSTVTVALSASPNGCAIQVFEVSGVSTSGSSGTQGAGQSFTTFTANNNSAVTGVAPSAASTANAWFSLEGVNASDGGDLPGANWTFLAVNSFTGNATGLHSAWTALSTGTTSVWTGVSIRRGVIQLELVADNPVVVGVPVGYQRQSRQPDRVPPVPVSIQGELASYLRNVVRILNAEAYISRFSGTDPNLSNLTGIPGNLAVNIGSASTWTRMWQMSGSIQSISTTGWKMMRMA